MKNNKSAYNKMKRYWKLILKDRNELDYSKWKKYTCFNNLMTQSSVVDYLISIDKELLNTYEVYQNILYSIKNNKYNSLEVILNNTSDKISTYMKTSVKTLKEYLPHIKNTLRAKVSNSSFSFSSSLLPTKFRKSIS